MLYHLDKQIGIFMAHIQALYGRDTTAFILTADHGVTPIVELVGEQGYNTAGRTDPERLIAQMNRSIAQQHGVENIIANFSRPSFYLDMPRFRSLEARKQKDILTDLKKLLIEEPTIMRVWTLNELASEWPASDDIATYFKQQLFPGRNGQLTVQPFPYTVMKRKANRGTHNTPYYQDVHVPLIMYQPGKLKHRIYNEQVSMLRFAPTLAALIGVPRPSACTVPWLPGFDIAR